MFGLGSKTNDYLVASQFTVMVGNDSFGYVKKVSGGDTDSKVATTNQNVGLPTKQITGVNYNEVTFEVHMSLSDALVKWMTASFDGKPYPQDVTVTTANSAGLEILVKTFHQAMITEIKIPGVETGKDDNSQFISVKIKPSWTETRAGDHKKVRTTTQSDGNRNAKIWAPHAFSLDLGSLPFNDATKVSDITWKQAVAVKKQGTKRTHHILIPGALELSDITVTTSAVNPALLDWFKSFAVDGHVGEGKEHSGTLKYLDSSGTKELVHIDLFGVGISNLKYADLDTATKDKEFTVDAKLYVENFKLTRK